jgi:hypothetical protein
VLRLNAGFSALTGLVALVAGGPVADLIGIGQVWLVRSTGAGLLGFAAAVALVAAAPRPALTHWSRLISVADLAWVVGTVGVVAAGWLASAGVVLLGLVAVVVLDLAIGQLLARNRLVAAAPPAPAGETG